MLQAKTLADRILLSRREMGLDQKELGRKAGISNGYISDIERGKVTNVGIEILFSLANALDVSPAFIVGLTEDPYGGIPDSELEQKELDTLTKEFINIFQQLSDDKKGVLLNLAHMLRSTDEPRIIGGNP